MKLEPIQGYPRCSTGKVNAHISPDQFYPAQLKEAYGKEIDGWLNKIYWGDNLQVMSHLLKSYRGKITLNLYRSPI